MSVSAPIRRFAPRCLYSNPTPRVQSRATVFAARHASSSSSSPSDSATSNPILDEYNRKNPSGTPARQAAMGSMAGDIASSSIFEDDRRAQAQAENASNEADGTQTGGQKRDPNNMLRVLDPDPNARERWERKKIIQSLRKGGRLNKEEFLMQTEREHTAKSEMMKTSIKKLGMLARQIQGKTLDEAITQMRFSKKKVAQDVMAHLEAARDEAIVMRGMGLGQVGAHEAEDGAAAPTLNNASADVAGVQPAGAAVASPSSPLDIQLKDGKRHTVTDTSDIFIEQAWVGRGPYGQLPDFRARGRVYIMRTPWTSLTVVLKEEATRVRQWKEREAKRLKQRQEKVWVPLPDRPVQGIRGQWYSW